jgi:hypothetical protein
VKKMTQGNVGQKLHMKFVAGGLTTFVVGIVMTAILWWFFGGFGFWELPGVMILFLGVAEILYEVYVANTQKRTSLLRGGLFLVFIGLAGYLSFAGYFVYGTFQMLSVIVTVVGIVFLVAGFFSAHKT